ncbi:putative RNA recognition motif domain, nucleotide-binding alpha-beta plait domain superfamily [Helianthus annuus]|nr:putative RNA recognition motif domain, nucleotide-binding alpha-beta plait domain superfamily [Helianthus annuus]
MYSVVDGYSVYIKGLPLNATPALLEKEFKKFGPIRQMAFKFEATWYISILFFFSKRLNRFFCNFAGILFSIC